MMCIDVKQVLLITVILEQWLYSRVTKILLTKPKRNLDVEPLLLAHPARVFQRIYLFGFANNISKERKYLISNVSNSWKCALDYYYYYSIYNIHAISMFYMHIIFSEKGPVKW